jgi:hypothetical protein
MPIDRVKKQVTHELVFKLGQRFLDAVTKFREHGLGLIKCSVLRIVNKGFLE